MELNVNADLKASDLIKRFNEIFPFLRLEIYHRGQEMGEVAHHYFLKDIVNKKELENFIIIPEMKVSEVEEKFWDKMGLQVSVFRKSGKTWLESSFTNYWSLERQNNLGMEMNDFMNIKPVKVLR